MLSRNAFLYILSISALLVTISQISRAQSSPVNSAYIVTTAGDTLRNFKIRKSFRLTNENKISYYYNDTRHSLPANDIESYFSNAGYFVSEFVKNENKHVLISYIIGGPAYFGQSFSKKGKAIFYLKRNDTQEVVCLANYKYKLLPLLQNYLPDFDTFYKSYNAKIYYDYQSIAELIAAYNAFKEPDVFVPVKYEYRENSKFGINASLGKAELKLNNDPSDFTGSNNYSFGLNFKHYYTRSSSFQFLLAYHHSGFIGTNEDVFIKSISIDPGMSFSKHIHPKLEIAVNAGLYLGYNIDSYLSRKSGDRVVLAISGFNLGPQLGVDLTYLKRYSFFINYFSYRVGTNEESIHFNKYNIKASTKNLQFGLTYYFGSIYSNKRTLTTGL